MREYSQPGEIPYAVRYDVLWRCVDCGINYIVHSAPNPGALSITCRECGGRMFVQLTDAYLVINPEMGQDNKETGKDVQSVSEDSDKLQSEE